MLWILPQAFALLSHDVPGAGRDSGPPGGDVDVSGDLCGTNLQVQQTGDEAKLLMLIESEVSCRLAQSTMAALLLRHWRGRFLRQTWLEPILVLELEDVLGDVGLGHDVTHGRGSVLESFG